jgi:four helix bundle protein
MESEGNAIETLDVFRRAYELSLALHRFSLTMPKIEQYGGLADQLRRSSRSVCSLMMEGSGRRQSSLREFYRYLTMAVGSAEETRLWLRYSLDLGYGESEHIAAWRAECGHVIRMLQGLRSRLEAGSARPDI